jgi:tRNA dimethylallyltransferase
MRIGLEQPERCRASKRGREEGSRKFSSDGEKIIRDQALFPAQMKKKILIVVGPTASGKSDLAVSLARKFNGEIISADSRQVYRGLDIGTGKITGQEMRGIRHHLLDVANPKNRFSAGEYRILARRAIDEIFSREKTPMICGGTGFYINAALDDDPFPDVPPNEDLRKRMAKKSCSQLLLILKKLDQKRAKAISKSDSERKNARRIIRAIEIAAVSKSKGYPWINDGSVLPAKTSGKRSMTPLLCGKYSTVFIGIKPSRDELRKRIHARLVNRIDAGMVDEARCLHARGLSWKRMEELGLEYRYLARYLQEKISNEELVEKLDTEIWHYAKRQMVWWKRNKKIKWFDPADKKKATEWVRSFLVNKKALTSRKS